MTRTTPDPPRLRTRNAPGGDTDCSSGSARP